MGKTFSSTDKSTINKQEELDKSYFDEEFNSLIRDCDIFLLAYLLKTATTEDNAMSINDMSEALNLLIPRDFSKTDNDKDPSFFPERTLRRRIEVFSKLEESDLELTDKIRSLIQYVLGGSITYRAADGINNGSNTKGNGKQKRFYFEHVLSVTDMDLIFASVRSNRFLSDEEKDYLLARLKILVPEYNYDKDKLIDNTTRHIFEINDLPKKPAPRKDATLPMNSSKLLSNIQTIYEAIQNNLQIEVMYGTYDINENTHKLDFHPRNPDKPYNVLNPYALMWYGGEYYLIATHYNYPNPVHYRIDRIISVKVHTIKNEKNELEEVKRNPIPETLKPFFYRANKKLAFDSIKYANTYPGMKLYDNNNKIDVDFECTSISLQILIDYFGPDIMLYDSPIKHSKDELDYNGKEQKFLKAHIRNVQYDNAYRFAIAQSEYLTLLGPDNLVKDVADKMQDIANRYKKYNDK